MSQIVAANSLLKQQIGQLQTNLDSATSIRLFNNPVTLTPGLAVGAFTEPVFGGYGRINPSGTWGAPIKQQDGEYQFNGGPYVWVCTKPPGDTVYGFFVVTNTLLWLMGAFPGGYQVTPGLAFSITLGIQCWALSIVPVTLEEPRAIAAPPSGLIPVAAGSSLNAVRRNQ